MIWMVTRSMAGVFRVASKEAEWFYVYGTNGMAEGLANYLNGGDRPVWLGAMRSASAYSIEGASNTAVVAVANTPERRGEMMRQMMPRSFQPDSLAC